MIKWKPGEHLTPLGWEGFRPGNTYRQFFQSPAFILQTRHRDRKKLARVRERACGGQGQAMHGRGTYKSEPSWPGQTSLHCRPQHPVMGSLP
jgi:hypothetical protein